MPKLLLFFILSYSLCYFNIEDVEIDYHNPIASGAAGIIYPAVHRNSSERYAAKIVKKDSTSKFDDALRELRIMRDLTEKKAKYTVKLKFFSVESDKIIIGMQRFSSDLRNLFTSDPETKRKNSDMIVAKMLIGLYELNKAGWIHFDLKPENVFLTEDLVPYIGDFGETRPLSSYSKNFGTFKYMPPEMINNSEVNEKSDVWSMGVIIFEFLTGKYPFGSGSRKVTKIRIRDVMIEHVDNWPFKGKYHFDSIVIDEMLVKLAKRKTIAQIFDE